MLRFDKATYLSLPFKFILPESSGNSLSESDILLVPEFSNFFLLYTKNI